MTTQVFLACMTTSALLAGIYCATVTIAWLAFAAREAGVPQRLSALTHRILAIRACTHCPCAGPGRS